MDEMNIQPVDFGDELVEAVERRFACPPVVLVGPVGGQVAGVSQRNALAPVVHTLGFGPAGARQTGLQIIQNVVGNVDAKRPHLFIVPSGAPESSGNLFLVGFFDQCADLLEQFAHVGAHRVHRGIQVRLGRRLLVR